MLRATAAIAALIVLWTAGPALARSGNPPDARTGAPGESTCAGCHGNLNTGNGSIVVTGPDAYAAGDTIDVFVQVEDAGQSRWGFEVTVLDDSNEPAGSVILTDLARTQLSVAGGTGRQYVKHTSLGTDPGTPNVSPGWGFRWAVPVPIPDAVTFYIVGIAANGNGSTSGDYTYTDVHVMDGVSAALGEDETTWGKIKSLFR